LKRGRTAAVVLGGGRTASDKLIEEIVAMRRNPKCGEQGQQEQLTNDRKIANDWSNIYLNMEWGNELALKYASLHRALS
jgi:hypothetical protein